MEYNGKRFLEKFKEDQFYVGFLKGEKGWFPICLAREEDEEDDVKVPDKPDRLCVSDSREKITELAEYLKEKIPAVEALEVLYLFPVEIGNLLEKYGLEKIEFLKAESKEQKIS